MTEVFRTQPIPADYFPPLDALPRFLLPREIEYPPYLNAAEALLDGALARGWGDLPAFHQDGQTTTYAALASRTNRLANGLRELGISLGDRVIVRMHDSPDLVATVLAIMRIGAVAIPTYTLF
ncbi:MAG: AMP-binding protein, partial [Chloroflexota bacterium]